VAALEGDVKVPLVGEVPKKAAAAGLVGVGILIVIHYVRKSQAAPAATAAAAATGTSQYPPDGTVGNPDDPYSTDPATGQTYGNEASGSGGAYGAYSADAGDVGDSAASSTYPWDGTVGDEADPYSLDPASGITFGNEGLATGGANANPDGGPPFANNSDWETWAIQQLTASDPDIDAGDLTTALGLYLNGQPVSAAQKTLIFDATGIASDPPVAGSGGYPPNVRTNGATGPATASVAVPNVVGDSQANAFSAISAAGLKATGSPVIPGTVIYVTKQTPAAGAKVAEGSTVTLVSSKNGGPASSSSGTATVPSIVGKEVTAASAACQAAGLLMSPQVPAVAGKVHTVTGQKPAAGSHVAKGSTVTITYKTS
jgi:hypothetical protein